MDGWIDGLDGWILDKLDGLGLLFLLLLIDGAGLSRREIKADIIKDDLRERRIVFYNEYRAYQRSVCAVAQVAQCRCCCGVLLCVCVCVCVPSAALQLAETEESREKALNKQRVLQLLQHEASGSTQEFVFVPPEHLLAPKPPKFSLRPSPLHMRCAMCML